MKGISGLPFLQQPAASVFNLSHGLLFSNDSRVAINSYWALRRDLQRDTQPFASAPRTRLRKKLTDSEKHPVNRNKFQLH